MPSFLHATRLSVTESGFLSDLILRFLTRPGCHICDDARPLVMSEAARIGAMVTELNVDDDDGLMALYGLRIPVVLGRADQVIAEGVIDDRKTLRKAFRATLGI